MDPLTLMIIASLVSASTTVGTGILNNQATKAAEKKSYGMAMLAREDEQKQQAVENKQQKQSLALAQNKFGYEKKMERETANKQAVANLGTSLQNLSKSGMDMRSFINSLYGKAMR